MKKFSWRGFAILVFVLATAFFLAPLLFDGLPSWWASWKLNLGLDLRGGTRIVLEVDTSKLTPEQADKAIDSNIEVIRNRIDKFGVTEPSIQRMDRLDEKRIEVQLPGVKDLKAAENLLSKTAMLEFKLLAPPDEADKVLTSIDQNLKMNVSQFPTLAKLARQDKALVDSLKLAADTLGTEAWVFRRMIDRSEVNYIVRNENLRTLSDLMEMEEFIALVPAGYQLAFGKLDSQNPTADREFYVLNSAEQMSGKHISKANLEYGSLTSSDPRTANKPYVSLQMTSEGARVFERVTADNVGKRLAILMDNVVYSAPNIQERIPGGRAQITGQFTTAEATELEILLNSPTLDAPIIPVSSSIIGASLGADSIKSGITAGIIGLLAVMIFMLIFYKASGLVADFVLVFNIGFILAMLTLFKATLTLPGIAGIILTIGMAVDANVVIFERIKEELDAGKTPRTAVDAGYNRATITVWDSNITTLIAAAVLYYIGSGPIRGFAVTLTIGIIGSMFCAIVFTRAIFDNLFLKSNKETMSI